MDWVALIGYVLTPITALVSWILGKRKRNNDAINEMQQTIDMLATKNSEYMERIVELQSEIASLKSHIERLENILRNGHSEDAEGN